MRVRSVLVLTLFSLSILSGCSEPVLAPADGGGFDGGQPGPDAAALDADAGSRSDGGRTEPCEPNPCTEANRTRCEAPMGVAECRCDPGFEERAGRCEPVTTCEPGVCGDHGTCEMGSGGPTCVCDPGHGGDFCESCDEAAGYYDDGTGRCTMDACSPNPCAEGGRTFCTVVDRRAVCSCAAGTHDEGGVCVPDVTCTPTSCAGHGTCDDAGATVSCACELGWAGASCDGCDETAGYHADGAGGCTTDACLPNPCAEPRRRVCTGDGGIVTCSCDPGSHLELDACVIDEVCSAATCGDHGACAVIAGRTTCACDAGWDGDACGACAAGYHDDGAGGCTTDPCLPSPCTATLQTACVAMGDTAICECDAGAHPDGAGGCTTDPCTPDPCLATNQACRVSGSTAECYTPPCDDGEPCTTDAIVGGLCVHTPLANGTSCTTDLCLVGETCGSGVCDGGSARACDDGNACTRDTCGAMGCAATADDTLAPPDDGVACTVGRCMGGASSHVRTDALCDDGLWCSGVEACAPGTGADADGCVVLSVPAAPGASTPCAPYVCDEATDAYVRRPRPTGSACNDGIPCTTGDACDAAGTCQGGLTSLCDPTASCTPSPGLLTTIDIGLAPVSGTITQNGATLPSVTPDYENGVIWARANDTGRLHRLALIDWARGSYPNYTRTAGSDRFQTLLVPGIYDILYQRAYQSSGDYVSERERTPSFDPVVNGYRVLREDVVVPAGGRTLDVDVGATVVTGVITQSGATLPMVTPDYENGVVWARARDTGKLHRLALIDWARGSYPNYTRTAGSDRIDTMLIPGAYDILYQRAYQSSGDYVSERERTPSFDPVVNGYRVLRENVMISGASATLDVDVGATVVTGVITQSGATLPMVTPDYENGVVWARARDTGKLHRLALIDWARGSYPNYTRTAGSDRIDTMLIPGAYDILYQRAYQSSGDYVSERERTPSFDPVVNGYRVLRENVMISGASATLDVDIGATVVTGVITQNGATLPMVTPDYENGVVWARARDTGKLHRLALIDWARGSYPNYTRTAGSDRIDTMLIPGAYDILYQRAYQSSGDYVSERERTPSFDPVVNGYRVLRENVVISGASATLDVDVGATVVTGVITQNGATLPMVTPDYENGVVWARARDTGKLHRLALIDWARGSYPNYTRTAGSDRIDTMLIPGAYDILYQRAYQSSGDYVSERELTPTPDPVVNGYRLLRENVMISGASTTLDVDIRSVVVAGTITMGGATLPLTTPDYENGVIWLRARDTGKLHRLALIDWARGSYPNYTRTAGSDRFTSTVIPGAYDILYQRAYQSSGQYVSEQERTPTADPVVNGYRVLSACVLVE